jgi:hypothetical protein
MPEPDMLDYLRQASVYLYTGTVPASYTLGLIEALMVGVPIVSIGPGAWQGPAELFEGHEFAQHAEDDPAEAREWLREYLRASDPTIVLDRQERARALFDVAIVGPQWDLLFEWLS